MSGQNRGLVPRTLSSPGSLAHPLAPATFATWDGSFIVQTRRADRHQKRPAEASPVGACIIRSAGLL
jgi:hypothetical protein